MTYVPHTESDVREMLAKIGVASIDDLFVEIPENLRLKGELNIPAQLDEHRLVKYFGGLAAQNLDLSTVACFLGAGIYDRYIPSTVGAVISRGEFLSAYTPYQPEVSQGYLQTIYEFQTMIADLYGMPVANASMYDGPTSMAEAALMAVGQTKRDKVVISDAVHPHYRQVLETYCWAVDVEVAVVRTPDGVTPMDAAALEGAACFLVQTPNFFGTIEDLRAMRAACDASGAMMIIGAEPIAAALLPTPGSFGADIVVGEGQPLGIAMGLGGPMLGLFACKTEYVRQIPGRIVGRTADAQGRSGFTMTLRTREQDIRREKATSNICTNEALMALAATVYMGALGKNGIRHIAESSVRNTQYAIQQLTAAGAKLRFAGRVFGEFTLDLGQPAGPICDRLLSQGIVAGLPLGGMYPEYENCLLVAVTEVRTKSEIDRFAALLGEALKGA